LGKRNGMRDDFYFLGHVVRRVAEFEPWPDSEVFNIHHVQEYPPI